VDWLLSHRLLGTPYQDTAYTLLAYDEAPMLDRAGQIAAGDPETLAMLTRSAAIMGLGTSFTGTTHSGSMAEHLISNFIDMFAGKDHPGTSHGEQVGVATLTVSKLQNQIFAEEEPPLVTATRVPEEELRVLFGSVAERMIEQTKKKALSASQAEELNRLLAEKWTEIRAELKAVALPHNRLFQAMKAAGCQLLGTDLGLKAEFYQDAVRYARFVRDRYSILDLADDSGRLSGFVEGGC
jgi:glycerol-1-phosphate dehydrogenase [NAD(P)+]